MTQTIPSASTTGERETLLSDALALFRRYQREHEAKAANFAHEDSALSASATEKAGTNRVIADRIEAALSRPSRMAASSEGEPAAWRRKPLNAGTGSGTAWVLYGSEDAAHYSAQTDRYLIEPLYTHPAPTPPVAVSEEMLRAERDEAQDIARVFAEHWPYGNAARDEALRRAICAVPSPDARVALAALAVPDKGVQGDQGPQRVLTAPNPNAPETLIAALKLAKSHLDHMAAWIGRDNRGYSFEALGEDMPAINDALRIDVAQLTAELTESIIQATIDASPQPLRDLGNMLCDLLDEDQWKKAEAKLLAVAHRGVETQARDRVEAFLDRVTRYSGGIDLHGAFLSFADLRAIVSPPARSPDNPPA